MARILSYDADKHLLVLQMPYDPSGRDQSLAKTIYGYRFDGRTKAWQFPATVQTARKLVEVFDPHAGAGYEEWWSAAAAEHLAASRAQAFLEGRAEITGDFGLTYHTEPYAHQRQYCEWAAMRFLAGLRYRAFLSEQGTGKTKCEIDMTLWELDHGGLRGMPLVFCPNSVRRNWAEEIYTHAPAGAFVPIIVQGSAVEKLELLQSAPDVARRIGAVPFLLVNYEVLAQPTQKRVLDELLRMADAGLIGKVLFDEATAVRNTKTKRGRAAYKLAKQIPIRVAMTGTPFPKRMTDIFGIMRVLHPEILGVSWPAFYRHHCEFGGYQGREVIGYRNGEELEEKVSRHAFRRLLSECTDLPEEINLYRSCDLTPAQVRATEDLRTQLVTQLESPTGASWALEINNALAQLLRFNQISSGFLETEGKEAVFTPNPKLDLLLSIIEEEIPEDRKAVIWCCYQYDVARIHDALLARGHRAVTFYGPDTTDVRAANERAFKEDPETRFIIATPEAGGYGLNWQVACWCIFYSYNFRWEPLEQARARIRRLTQRQPMSFLWLRTENPVTRDATHGVHTGISQIILDNLAETGTMARFMTGDFRRTGEDPSKLLKRLVEVM